MRRASSSVTRGSTVTARAAPFTFRFRVAAVPAEHAGARVCALGLRPRSWAAVAETLAHFMRLTA